MKARLLAWISWITFLVSAVSEWGLNIDLPLTPAVWLVIATFVFFATNAPAALTTNNWNVGSGKWETGSNWTGGAPSPADAIDFVTGGVPVGPRVITIDQAAVSSNLMNGCLTISNLTVGGTSTAPNTLFLNTDASNTPGNNIVLTWMTPAGTTNQLQVTSGGSTGAYSTNGFTNLGAQMLIEGSGVVTTNYIDIGGATNQPARYYRMRLVL